MADGGFESRSWGPVTVLFGERGGRYPQGNSLLVEGGEETVIVDPSLGLVDRHRAGRLPRADWVLNSHCHEDHVAGNHLYRSIPWVLHEADLPGLTSLDAMLDIYGAGEDVRGFWKPALVEQFHYEARPDPTPMRGGDRFDLGGGVTIEVVHLPGHTRGHCGFRIEPGGVFYLGDIDLSSFGPYYGDAWSDLEDFERSLEEVAKVEADAYATFHHIGVLESREAYLERLAKFRGVIARREERLLEFLEEERSMDEIVAHRFVYRPQDDIPFADMVERRSMGLHLDRLERDGRVTRPAPNRFFCPERR